MMRLRPDIQSKLQHGAGFLSVILGGTLFFTSTIWLAKSHTKELYYSAITATVIGILNGILQLSAGTIFMLLGIDEKWKTFSIFNLINIVGCVITFGFSVVDDEEEQLVRETHWLTVISALDIIFGLLVLFLSFFSRTCFIHCKCRKISTSSSSSVPYSVMP